MKIFQQAKKTIGSDVVLTICSEKPSAEVNELMHGMWQIIDNFDQTCSRFRNDSEITYLNNHAGKWLKVSPELKDFLVTSKKMSTLTGGIFNPFILPALQRAGYLESFMPSSQVVKAPDYRGRKVVSCDLLQIKNYEVFIPADSAIDSGGIGKGYLLELLGNFLKQSVVENYWLSLGGDILAKGHDIFGKPWQIGVSDANNESKKLAIVKTPKKGTIAVATSGVTKRKGVYKNKKWHHIINHESGEPADTDILTATTSMTSALLADTYASCLVALGSVKSKEFIERHEISDALVQTDKNITYGHMIKLAK